MLKIKDNIELKIFCKQFNNIIKQAIIHGGDTGGAYFINEGGLLETIRNFLSWTGLNKYLTIYADDFPKLIIKEKIDD